MSYQVLARKWRPKSFDTLVGQEHVVRALSNALDQQRLHHAYLFTGTRGVGKTTLARILAKSLNCETGITSKPCGACSACTEIDKGRFIDLIEVDAASNTQVDNMRDLLDNAQYAPTVGRFKVYIIDEVHMLTRNSFNAMLKTLEEPPAHVKFILATTDPQKMPVTVLSRCLQFNLRQMASTSISGHLQAVLQAEHIQFEATALHLIARAASGSMRDALSLLDQAIAYGGNAVREQEVRSMLGAIDQSYLYNLLHALIQKDGQSLMQQATKMDERSISFDGALNDLAMLLQQIAVAQAVPDTIAADLPEREALLQLAQQLSAEEIQLYYQIALLSRRDLGLAPDEYAGFTMALLRMLAFRPSESVEPRPNTSGTNAQSISAPSVIAATTVRSTIESSAAPSARASLAAARAVAEPPPAIANPTPETSVLDPVKSEAIAAPVTATMTPAPTETAFREEAPPELFESSSLRPAIQFDGNWRGLVDQLKLGLARALAQHCELVGYAENEMQLMVPEQHKHLIDPNYQDKLKAAIDQYFGRKIALKFEIGGTGNTPAQQIFQEKEALQSEAVSAIQQDDFVQALVKDFGAQIIPSSIKPIQ